MCWLIGTITSATDPVAVVALLKELGTDKALGTLIEGESLLNDGSAVVLYVVIKNWIEHTNSDGTHRRSSNSGPAHAQPMLTSPSSIRRRSRPAL